MGNNQINKIFAVTDFIDKARWETVSTNDVTINFCIRPLDLSANVKILTHLICYVTDRQMPFESIWNVGGFVFSDLILKIENNITENDIIDKLLDPDSDSSFFMTQRRYGKINTDFKMKDENKYLFVAEHQTGTNEILQKYNFKSKDRPYFVSRFYPSDYYAILSTLQILKEFDFQIGKVIVPVLQDNETDLIRKVLFVLYLLTYWEIGQKNTLNIADYNSIKELSLQRKRKVLEILTSKEKFESEFLIFSNSDKIFNQKRAWCSLRDFCKSSYKYDFIRIINQYNPGILYKLFDDGQNLNKQLFSEFELPGDVWNNNDTFRKCVFTENGFVGKPKFSEFLRDAFNKHSPTVGYPEQFDITFDFVQKMCNQPNNCKICPYGKLNGKAVDFDKLCHQSTIKYCPIVYACGNYPMFCKGVDCYLLQL